jgi:uncharacterized repeat protein (TIGR01451 family)
VIRKGFAIFALTLLGGWAAAAVPTQPSRVTISGNQLILEKRLPDGTLGSAQPYIFKGVAWSPGTAAPVSGIDPKSGQSVPYGFFFDGDWRIINGGLQGHDLMNLWLKQEMRAHYQADIALMAQMKVNTVRVYLDFGTNPADYATILDEFYNNGIMVILTVVASRDNIEPPNIYVPRYIDTVNLCKNHPAILMWSIGNEWNLFPPFLYGYADMPSAIAAVNSAAGQIKAADSFHPVTSSLGDRFTISTSNCGTDPASSDIPTIFAGVPNVDIWGLNVFRGDSFGALFNQWSAVSVKPFYLSEFGTDSFRTTSFLPLGPCDNRAQASGVQDQAMQATTFSALWTEIAGHLSAFNPAERCVGGFAFEFNDELWKVGDFNVSLGDLVNYIGPDGIPGTADDDSSYNAYNSQGFLVNRGHPDNFANEEHFGLVSSDRSIKAAYNTLRALYTSAPNVTLTKSVDRRSAVRGAILTYSIAYHNIGHGDATNFVIQDAVPAGSSVVAGSISGGGTLSAGTIQWNLGTVPAAASGVVSFKVQVL